MVDATQALGAQPVGKPLFSETYKTTVLWLLVLAYTFNFIDRTIIGTIGQAIREDLKLTATELGMLGGLAFAILYTTLGVPIARMAERHNRVSIISIAIAIWSIFTALCGVAADKFILFAFRIGVGVGEAGLSPPAHSLISDYYEPKRRASALSIYAFGIPLGSMIGAVAGGWIAQNLSWRLAFVIVGLPGLLIAILLKVFVKEPPRGYSEQLANPDRPLAPGDETAPPVHVPPSVFKVAGRIFGRWSFFHMAAGITVASFASYGTGQFTSPYFILNFGLNYAQVGLIFGLIGGFSAGVGTLVGGFLTDWASKRSARWYALVPAFGLLIACPLYVYCYTRPSWQESAVLLLIPGIFHYTYLGPTFGVIQNAVSLRMRATATALLFFVLNLIALGFGPPFCGWCVDQFSAFLFAHPDVKSIPDALTAMINMNFLAGHGGAVFAAACPGGVAPKGAAAAVVHSCLAASALGHRQGIVVNLLIYAWASAHYFMAAITLPSDLAKALEQQKEAH